MCKSTSLILVSIGSTRHTWLDSMLVLKRIMSVRIVAALKSGSGGGRVGEKEF
jgi:hypothetical protein